MSILGGKPNILLIIADDLGEDVIRIVLPIPIFSRAIPPIDPEPMTIRRRMQVVTNDGTVEITGALPNLSLFLRNGVYFEQAWAQPSCSSTRASIYTGLHPWKSGVGNPIPEENPTLDPSLSFTTLPELLPNEYVSGLFGKWHLAGDPRNPNYPVVGSLPTDHGWDRHVGTLDGTLDGPMQPPSNHRGYKDWYKVDSDNGYFHPDGVLKEENIDDYATQHIVEEAAAWINAQDPATPWFVTIAHFAPHDPFHIPPHGYDTATAGAPAAGAPATPAYMFNVMTQNMDTNIGKLLGIFGREGEAEPNFDPIPGPQLRNTVIIFLGDNGSPVEVAIEEEKTLIFEGSVHIPMIIADGQAVMNAINSQTINPRFLHASRLDTEHQSMVHAVDLYMTIARLADPSSGFPSNTDSMDLRSMFTTPKLPTVPRRLDPVNPGDLDPPLLSVRSYNFSQWYTETQERATIRNRSYKLNYDRADSPEYSLYRYENGEIPEREDDGTATDLYDDAVSGADMDALNNLNELLDELISNYKSNMVSDFPDPRPFPL